MPDVVLCERCQYTLSARDPPECIFSRAQLRSLHLPNEVEASNIASTVEELDLDLSIQKQEISKVKKILNELKRHRKLLLRSRNEHRALISPVRKLPAEILGEIFNILCRSGHGLELKQTTAETVTQSLSQVCSVWRRIVRSTPALWSHLWIDISHRYDGHAMIPRYLELSGQAPLTLFITASELDFHVPDEEDDLYETYPLELEDHAWDTLGDLLDSSSRWKNATMRFAWSIFCEMRTTFSDTIPDLTWTSLEALTLEWIPSSTTRERDFGLWGNPGELPNLRYLSLPAYREWFPFPFTQLSSFGPLEGWNPLSNVVPLFQSCHNIEHFTVAPNNWSAVRPVALPSPEQVPTRSLSIEDGVHSIVRPLLDSLIASRLISLTIENESAGRLGPNQDWRLSLTSFILRSQCPLQKLTLKTFGSIMDTEDFLQFLLLVPTLTHLTLHHVPRRTLDDAFYEGLTASSNAPIILPHLQYMDLQLSDRDRGAFLTPLPTPTTILTMVESRSTVTLHGAEFLNSFKFSLYIYSFRQDDLDWEVDRQSRLRIEALIEGGMELSMSLMTVEDPDSQSN